jgi:hypothetical protein
MSQSQQSAYSLALSRAVRAGPAWYQGDFHCHTNCSDGALTPQELLQVARGEKLDFFAITDHNTLAGYAGFGAPADLCIIPGVEVTFDRGHFNVFGIEKRQPWIDAVCGGPMALNLVESGLTMSDLLVQTTAGGLLNSINHPLLAPWAWLDAGADLAYLQCLEIWNDPSWPDNRQANPQAIDLWTRWLNDGYRITAIGGSDFHRPTNKPGVEKPPDRLGLPRTYVYAEALSGAAILDAVRRRRVYVSMGPQVSFEASVGERVYAIGADLGAHPGEVEFVASVMPGGEPGVARIVRNGETAVEATLSGEPLTLRYQASVPGDQPVWFRFDVYDEDGLVQAITNPIYGGPLWSPARRRYGDYVDLYT